MTEVNGGDDEERKDNWQVILRNEDERRVVLYDSENNKLVVNGEVEREAPKPLRVLGNKPENGAPCPLCGADSSFRRKPTLRPEEDNVAKRFMASDYFRLLQLSIQGEETSVPPVEDPSRLGADSLNEGYYERFFLEEKRLGSGSRGSVFLCQHVMDNVQLGRYAVKKISVGDNHKWLVNVLREVKVLEGLHHPNIIEYKHTWLEKAKLCDFGVAVPCLFVLTEYANSGNLAQYMLSTDSESSSDDESLLKPKQSYHRSIKRRRLLRKLKRMSLDAEGSRAESNAAGAAMRVLPESLIWHFLVDILSGLDHLHSHGIVHRDIKPQNLLLHIEDNSSLPRVLLSDFGECEFLSRIEGYHRTGYTGTMEFVAPELLEVSEDGLYYNQYNQRCDIWSLGIVLYQLTYSKLPWRSNATNVKELTDEILSFNGLPVEMGGINRSAELGVLIRSMMVRDPANRPTTQQLLEVVASRANRNGSFSVSPLPSPMTSADQAHHIRKYSLEHIPTEPVPLLLDGDPAPDPEQGNALSEAVTRTLEVSVGDRGLLLVKNLENMNAIAHLAFALAKSVLVLSLTLAESVPRYPAMAVVASELIAIAFR
mmetsp:Transcript_5416/g.23033  ORF Transcript_5416/g.23033 Transcript_5416/m.23033 type:complete len:596 (-) Transcript_5416:787-2574(-)